MGAKMVKALVVQGNGSVHVKDLQAVADLSDYMLREVVGSNNNHVVPQTQQEWAEFYDQGPRWNGAQGPVLEHGRGRSHRRGEPKPGELNTVGYRCMKSAHPFDLGEVAEKVPHQDGRLPQLPHPLLRRLARRGEGRRRQETGGQHLHGERNYTFMNNILKKELPRRAGVSS